MSKSPGAVAVMPTAPTTASNVTPLQPVLARVPTPVAGLPRIATYEELEGGHGREIFFRPDRYRRADLGAVEPVVLLTVGGVPQVCGLIDISQNGLAFLCPKDLSFAAGDELKEMVVSLDGHEVFHGDGRVVSLRDTSDGRAVGVSFSDSLVNIEDVLVLRDLRAWAKDRATGLGLSSRPWYVTGHERFKALISELRLFLQDAQEKLQALEASLPFQVVHSEIDSPARVALIDMLKAEFVAPLVRYSEAIDSAVRGASEKDLQALKEFSMRQLHDFIMQAPIMARARHKPLGYPGDFEVMRFMYERNFDGTTLFSRALNLAFTQVAASQAVVARKEMLKQELRRAMSLAAGRTDCLRILAIAAGPAQEIYEVLRDEKQLPVKLEIVLLDQERLALSYAYSRLRRLIDTRWPGKVTIHFRYDTIRKLLADRSCIADLGEFDFVYASGLFDYLSRSSAVRLTSNLYRHVALKGSLYIGNMAPQNPSRWLMEHHLDWFLIFRTHEQMLDFATAGAPDSDVGIIEERTGVNPFVRITRT